MNDHANAPMPLRDAEFKDEQPLKTVERIKGILSSCGIETTEVWYETSVPYCFALSVQVDHSTFSVNGKGLTRAFALASAYGELMERLQLGYIGNRNVQKDGHYAAVKTPGMQLSTAELLAANGSWYALLAERLQKYTGTEESAQALLERFADADKNVNVTAYYNVVTGQKVFYPTIMQMRVYTANGCAAGNTPEEAIVQAISEIVERKHHLRIIDEELCVPTIPDDFLKRFQVAYGIIQYVRSCGYRVTIKDCSLDTGFPVVGVCIIDEKSGRYHTHFGAYPVFEIALERALTESFQGRTIDNIATFENFVYKKESTYSISSLTADLTKGSWERFPGFFVGESAFTFREDLGFRGANNKELLRECIAFFASQGWDVLVRDCSCLGFPTYQVIVPGYSEVFSYRLSPKLDDHRYSSFAMETLRNPSSAKLNDMMGFLMHLSQTSKLTKSTSRVHGFVYGSKLAATLNSQTQNLLQSATLGYVYYALGKYDEAIKCAEKMVPLVSDSDAELLICLKRYLSLLIHQYDTVQIRQILDFFHKTETVEALYCCLAQKVNPFDRFTLHCDLSCTDSCPIRDVCYQKHFIELTGFINEKTAQLSFDDSVAYLQSIITP